MGDASQKMICAAIYARFEETDGSFSREHICARSKGISNTSTACAELLVESIRGTPDVLLLVVSIRGPPDVLLLVESI